MTLGPRNFTTEIRLLREPTYTTSGKTARLARMVTSQLWLELESDAPGFLSTSNGNDEFELSKVKFEDRATALRFWKLLKAVEAKWQNFKVSVSVNDMIMANAPARQPAMAEGLVPSFAAFSMLSGAGFVNEAVEGDGGGETLTMFYDGSESGKLTLNKELKSEEGKNNEGLTTRSVVHIGRLATTGTSVHNIYVASDDEGKYLRNTADRQGNTWMMSKVGFSQEDAEKFAAVLQKVLRMRAVTTFSGAGFKPMTADQLTKKTQ